MKILLTGATGFLGQYILNEIDKENTVFKLSRNNGNINVDLSLTTPVQLPQVELVIHNAGKAHVVPQTDAEKLDFYNVNVKGTQHLLDGLSLLSVLPKAFLFISSVAVYGKIEGEQISESAPLLATDAYGKSKIEAEALIQSWCNKNNILCTILRLPLLVGENPPGNLGAMIKGIKKGYYFNIGGGVAKKSMVLASDVAKHIIKAAEKGGVYNLTDGYHPSFYELSNKISSQINNNKNLSLPLFVAKILGKFGDLIGNKAPVNTQKIKKITSNLTFDDTNARKSFNWNPQSVLSEIKVF